MPESSNAAAGEGKVLGQPLAKPVSVGNGVASSAALERKRRFKPYVAPTRPRRKNAPLGEDGARPRIKKLVASRRGSPNCDRERVTGDMIESIAVKPQTALD